jgi:hypothetical protein
MSLFAHGLVVVEKIAETLKSVIIGAATAAERLDYIETNISRFGPSVSIFDRRSRSRTRIRITSDYVTTAYKRYRLSLSLRTSADKPIHPPLR